MGFLRCVSASRCLICQRLEHICRHIHFGFGLAEALRCVGCGREYLSLTLAGGLNFILSWCRTWLHILNPHVELFNQHPCHRLRNLVVLFIEQLYGSHLVVVLVLLVDCSLSFLEDLSLDLANCLSVGGRRFGVDISSVKFQLVLCKVLAALGIKLFFEV